MAKARAHEEPAVASVHFVYDGRAPRDRFWGILYLAALAFTIVSGIVTIKHRRACLLDGRSAARESNWKTRDFAQHQATEQGQRTAHIAEQNRWDQFLFPPFSSLERPAAYTRRVLRREGNLQKYREAESMMQFGTLNYLQRA